MKIAWLAISSLYTTLPACVHAHDADGVHIGDADATPRAKPTPIDLSPLKVFRNAFAVTSVGPYEHHFTVWYQHIEPAYEELRVRKDPATGKLHIAVDNGMFGGIGAPPNPPKASPPDVTALQSELAAELKERAPDARDWTIEYEGQYRTVTLQEMMPTLLEGTTTRIGWKGSVVLEADATLTHLLKATGEYETDFGLIECSEPMQWVTYSLPPEETGTKLLIDSFVDAKKKSPEKTAVAEAALEAARRLDTHAVGPTIAEVAQKQGDSLLPADIDQKLHAELSFYARPAKGIPFDRQQQIRVPVAIRIKQAVHQAADGTREGIVGGVHVKATATLTPRTPLAKDLPPGPQKFEGMLHLVVTDDSGHTFDRSYPASGDLLVDGDAVVSPAGLSIPGSSGPSREMDALHTTFPGRGDFATIDMYLTAALESDPREPY